MKEPAKRDVESVRFTEFFQNRQIRPRATTTIENAERLVLASFQ